LSADRSRARTGTKRKIILEKDSLAVRLPKIAESWADIENRPLTADLVYFADNTNKFWWKCQNGHLWQTKISSIRAGHGCLVCAGQIVVEGINDFASQVPHLAGEFAKENGGILASQILATSSEKYFWQCALGHLYRSTANQRTRGQGCPFCSNRRVLAGFNDLRTVAGDISFEWNLKRNNNVQPDAVLAKSTKTYWWICRKGHEWQAQPFRRLVDKGCPYCTNRQLLKGFNDISTRYPQLNTEWDWERNGNLELSKIVSKNHNKFYWQCASGHHWSASLVNRINGSGCPSCASFGFNPNAEAIFYVISNYELGALKVGITNFGNNRLDIWSRLGWQTLHTDKAGGREILNIETQILRWLRKDLGLPQYLDQAAMMGHNGATETFELSAIHLSQLIEKIKKIKISYAK
jgi:Probable Zinc-ribbon domain